VRACGMRRIAVVGAGVSGLLTAHGLLRAGYTVTLFSDRTAEQWLAGRPTGTAARFTPALAYERALGLDYWHAECPKIVGAQIVYCPAPGNRLATLTGRQPEPGLAIDVRLQSHRWMHELVARGGEVVIESVSVARLEELAAAYDLVIVAAGHGPLAGLFERDELRSVYAGPQRSVAMVVVHGPTATRAGMPFPGVKNNILEGVGEAVWLPYYHRDHGACWNLIFEAKIGGPMDVFGAAKTGAEALALAVRTIEALTPWEAEWARGMQLADENGWLVGKITPTVRRPVGRLPSGRVVACVGDAAVHFDPLAAQGANNGAKMARHMVEAIVARGAGAFDAEWMTGTFETFWADHGEPAYALTNLMLEPMNAAGKMLLIAQYGSDGVRTDGKQAIADAFAASFADARPLLAALGDVRAARRFIAAKTGRWWGWAVISGALGIARGQLRRLIGRDPGHPATA
jgi:flavin-dependent dehydrogenase